MHQRGLSRWADAPRRVRVVASATVLLLAYGTVVHVVQLLAAGLAPYPELPGWLRGYFVGLTVLDPLAAVLLARARRSGVVLAVAVLVTDAAANAWANLVLDASPGLTPGRVGTAVITGLAVVLLAAARPLWRHGGRLGASPEAAGSGAGSWRAVRAAAERAGTRPPRRRRPGRRSCLDPRGEDTR